MYILYFKQMEGYDNCIVDPIYCCPDLTVLENKKRALVELNNKCTWENYRPEDGFYGYPDWTLFIDEVQHLDFAGELCG